MRVQSFLIGLLFSATAFAAESPIQLLPTSDKVAQFSRLVFRIVAPTGYSNPFDPAVVDLHVELTGPDGVLVVVPAFFCQDFERRRPGQGGGQRDWSYPVGNAEWKVRFAPSVPGAYRAQALLRDAAGERRSASVTFECMASPASKGFVRVAARDPRYLEFNNQQPFFPIGQNLAFIGSQQYVTVSKAEDIFGKLADNGANYLRIWTCADDWAIAIEARKSAWGRSWSGKGRFVPMPGFPGKMCLLMSRSNAVQEVNPTHPVALRPGTRYVFSARVQTTTNAILRAEIHGRTALPTTSAPEVAPAFVSLRQEFTTAATDWWLGPTRFRLEGEGRAWISDVSLKEANGGPELLWEADMNRPVRGFYNPLDCFLLDELITAAEQKGIYLQLCMLTRDLYMSALQDPSSTNYDTAINDAKKFFRHAIGRWGCSTSVAAWEYWNEMNPNLPTGRFYTELAEFFEREDPYHHLRTTSTWGPSAQDCRHPKLDVADVHFYLRPADKGRLSDEVDAVLERTRWLRQQAPNKPAHLGEFGLADDKWRITEAMQRNADISDVHNATWASALSGASGTAMFWWWERIDQRNGYAAYKTISRFIADVPWNSGAVRSLEAKCSNASMRLVGLRAGKEAWLWLFDPAAAWSKVAIEKQSLPERLEITVELRSDTASHVTWCDTRSGANLLQQQVSQVGGVLRITAPSFRGDIACRITAQ